MKIQQPAADPRAASRPDFALPEGAAAALRGDGLVLAWTGRRGILLCNAATASAVTVNGMLSWGRGLTCFAVPPERAMALGLVLAGAWRNGQRDPVALRSVEAADCTGTGISAADRALTLRAAGTPEPGTDRLKSPGHVIPVMVGAMGGDRAAPAALALDVLWAACGLEVAGWTDVLDDAGELASLAWCRGVAGRLGVVMVEA